MNLILKPFTITACWDLVKNCEISEEELVIVHTYVLVLPVARIKQCMLYMGRIIATGGGQSQRSFCIIYFAVPQ